MELGSFPKAELGLPGGLEMLDSAAESDGCWGRGTRRTELGPGQLTQGPLA